MVTTPGWMFPAKPPHALIRFGEFQTERAYGIRMIRKETAHTFQSMLPSPSLAEMLPAEQPLAETRGHSRIQRKTGRPTNGSDTASKILILTRKLTVLVPISFPTHRTRSHTTIILLLMGANWYSM